MFEDMSDFVTETVEAPPGLEGFEVAIAYDRREGLNDAEQLLGFNLLHAIDELNGKREASAIQAEVLHLKLENETNSIHHTCHALHHLNQAYMLRMQAALNRWSWSTFWPTFPADVPFAPFVSPKCIEQVVSPSINVASLVERHDTTVDTYNERTPFKQSRQMKVEILRTEIGEKRVVEWPVDASKFGGNDRQIVSSSFEISPGVTCRLMIQASVIGEGRGQAGFRRAKGKGSIHLKCEANTSAHVPQVSFSLAIGANGSWQPSRGPAVFSFSNGSVCGLPCEGEWNFRSVSGKTSKICIVRLELERS